MHLTVVALVRREPLQDFRRPDGPRVLEDDFVDDCIPEPRIVGEARVTQLGKTVAFMEGRLTADEGVLIAIATANARLVDAGRALR